MIYTSGLLAILDVLMTHAFGFLSKAAGATWASTKPCTLLILLVDLTLDICHPYKSLSPYRIQVAHPVCMHAESICLSSSWNVDSLRVESMNGFADHGIPRG